MTARANHGPYVYVRVRNPTLFPLDSFFFSRYSSAPLSTSTTFGGAAGAALGLAAALAALATSPVAAPIVIGLEFGRQWRSGVAQHTYRKQARAECSQRVSIDRLGYITRPLGWASPPWRLAPWR